MDKRKTQISLPLNYHEKEFKDNVKQHWNITFSRQGRISVFGKRIIALVLAQIQENDNHLKRFYQMDVSDIMKAGEIGGKSAYQEAKKALDELARQTWSIEDVEKEIYRPKQLINTSTLESKEGFEYGYKNGVITIVLNPALEPYFIEMSHYSKYELKNYMKFTSWYSMRMWEILSAWEDKLQKGEYWYAPLEDFRGWMDCEKKYQDVNLMLRYTLSEPIKELKSTKLEFDYKKRYASKGRGRPRLVGLDFYLINPQGTKPASQKLAEWAEKSSDVKRAIERGREWKISDENLYKCLPIIKKDVWKLFIDFKNRQNSNDPIKDVAKFCNSAILIAAGLKEPKNKAEGEKP